MEMKHCPPFCNVVEVQNILHHLKFLGYPNGLKTLHVAVKNRNVSPFSSRKLVMCKIGNVNNAISN